MTSLSEPTITGHAGRAWQAQPTEITRTRWPAGLSQWLLHCPGAHPVWSWYVVNGVTLRDIPGVPAAKLHFIGATHEVSVIALVPEYQPDDTWCSVGPGGWPAHHMTPPNLVEQFVDLTDEHAVELTLMLVRSFCDGRLSPDTDFRSMTQEALAATASHLRAGKHEVL